MPKIRSAAEISKKWATVTPGRASDYEAGVKNPLEDWGTQTLNSEATYEEGVTKAITEKRFGKGVKEAGTEKWKRKAVEVGVGRWPTGVRVAEEDYQKGFAPFRDVIEKTVLPRRYPKGDPRNIERVAKLATELHKAKIK